VPPSTPASASVAVRGDVVVRLLGGQRHARGLGVEAHQSRARVARAEALAQLARPDPPRSAGLGDLLEEVDVRVEEEAPARRELVDVEPARDELLDVRSASLAIVAERARMVGVVAHQRRHIARASNGPTSCGP
jgi:hypothetical protein